MANIVRNSFYRGIVSSIEPTIIPDNSLANGINVISDISGILRLREGSIALFPNIGMGNIQGITSAFDQIIFVFNGNLYKYQDNTRTAIKISDEVISTNYEQPVTMIQWTESGSPVLYIFGGNGIFKTDGETVTEITPYEPKSGEEPNMLANEVGPQHGHLATLKASLSQRVAVAGLAQSPNTVYLSAPLNVSYFPLSQIIQLPDDGGRITGITNWYNTLIIFRDKDIWAFFGSSLTDDSASLVLQDNSVGCIAPNSITHVPDVGICFVGPDNIYALQGVSGVENQSRARPVSDDIANFVQRAIKEEGSSKAVGIYHDREFIVSFPHSIRDQRIFRMSLKNDIAWYINNGPLANHYLVHNQELYGTYPDRGLVYRLTSDSLNDQTIEMEEPQFGSMFNGMMFNEGEPGKYYQFNRRIPFSVTFRRENLQPGPARIKRIFLYIMSLGNRQDTNIRHFGNVFNRGAYNTTSVKNVSIDTTTSQNFNVTVMVDGNEIILDEFKISSRKIQHELLARSEPIRIYEARIRPSIKGHYAQIKVEGQNPGELIAILGYGIDFQQKGRIRGIRQGVSQNKDW